ncbi:MAG: hypothetical protein JXR76_00265 [Deltaproteobacteria bacterium]|nr:hypothetical protein [Deltaproteobacteria bacterium]
MQKNGWDRADTIVGVSGGVNRFTPDTYAPQLAIDVTALRRPVGLVIRGTVEWDSNFEIKSRPFKTRAASLALGPGMQMGKNRFGLAVALLAVFRYWEVTRADIVDAKEKLAVDFGAGLYVRGFFYLTHFAGLYLQSGVEMFPRARQIVIEDGPGKRLGLFHIPFNLGIFIQF